MLGDVDRQRSMLSWLQRRRSSSPAITTWAIDNGRMLRAPRGTTHVVLDTPGALYDHDLAKLLVSLDAVVVPIGPSIFDRDASLDFLAEISKLPRIPSGRCKLIAVGMRWPIEKYDQWISAGRRWDWPLLTVIPDASSYRTCLENGESVFDPHHSLPEAGFQHWEPLIEWLENFWSAAPTADAEQGQSTTDLAHVQRAPAAGLASISAAATRQSFSRLRQHPAHVEAATSPEIPAYLLHNAAPSAISKGEPRLAFMTRLTAAQQPKVSPAGSHVASKAIVKRGWLERWFVP